MVDFGEKLKKLRKEAGYTQQELAEKIWVTKTSISYYELSDRMPSPEVLVKLAAAFHVTTDYLLGLEDGRKYLDVSGLSEEDIALLEQMAARLRKQCRNE